MGATVDLVIDERPIEAPRYLPVIELTRRALHGFELISSGPLDRELEQSIRVAASWRMASTEGPTVMIDAEPSQLHADLDELIAALLCAYHLRSDALMVRIATYSQDAPIPVLDRLVERGVGIAVREPDLRGAELGLLAGAPIDVIELPSELVDRVDLDLEARHRLGRRIALAHQHDWLTMARGLDRLGQVDILTGLGCELASGPAVGPLLERPDADRVVARYFPGPIARPRRLAS